MNSFDLGKTLSLAATNPSAFLDIGINYIRSRLDGAELPDANSPLIQLMEFSSAVAAQQIAESIYGDNKAYPLFANSYEDLYGWMSDKDWLNRFCTPSFAKFTLAFPRDALVAAMVPIPGSTVKKIMIPRYTTFRVGELYDFTLLYPLEIRLLNHGGLQIVYNTDIMSPVETLSDNVMDWEVVQDNNQRKLVLMHFNLNQLSRKTQTHDIIQGVNFVANTEFAESQYFYTRVFAGDEEKGWRELLTTHSETKHDIRKVTAVLTVTDNVLTVKIPPIYFNNGLINSSQKIRIDLYTSKGDLTLSMSNYQSDDFSVEWGKDIDAPENVKYSSVVTNLEYMLFSTDTIRGGANGVSFENLRKQVINNMAATHIPVTPIQIEGKLERKGYDVLRSIDNLSNRIFLASKMLMPAPVNEVTQLRAPFTSPVSSGMSLVQSSISELVKLPGVYDNGLRCTISPKTLFLLESGKTFPLTADRYPDTIASTNEGLVNELNLRRYIFSPFHYVIDATDNTFAVRAYYMDAPSVKSRQFIAENVTAELEVSTLSYQISRTAKGYSFEVLSQVGESYQALRHDQIFLQLAFKPVGENSYAYINAELVATSEEGDQYLWRFEIETNYDFDSKDNLIVDNFSMFDQTLRNFAMGLTTEFMLIYSVSDYTVYGLEPSEIDKMLGRALLPSDAIGVIQEAFTIALASPLTYLSRMCSALGGSEQYLHWSEDVYDFYEADVYDINPATGLPNYTIVDGKVIPTKLHSKGDPKIVDGKHLIKYFKGDVKLDADGNPIIVSDRPTLRIFEMMMLDGLYYYANDRSSIDDRDIIPNHIVNTVMKDVASLYSEALDQTWIYYYPKRTIGNIDVMVDDGLIISINSQLSFNLKIQLSETSYNNESYVTSIERTFSEVVNNALKRETVSVSNIIDTFSERVDENVKGFSVKMFSGAEELTTFTVLDNSMRASVKRIAVINDEGKVSVREDITIDPKNHTPRLD